MFTLQELQAARDSFPVKPVNCPHCGAELKLAGPGAVVFATRSCPRCGNRVVAEPEEAGTPPFSREQFDDACAVYVRASHRAVWVFLAGFLILFAGVVVTALYRDTIRDTVRPVVDPSWFFQLVMLGPLVATTSVGCLLLSRARRGALKCPHCTEPCSVAVPHGVNLTRLTGNCAKCGRRLLHETPPEEPAGPLPTVDEFKAANRRAMRGDWVGLLLIALALIIPFGVLIAVQPERIFAALEQRYGVMTAAVVWSVVLSGWMLGMCAIAVLGLRWVSRRHMRKRAAEPALNCPHCNAALLATSVVIASKRCPACRRRVLAEPEASPAASRG